MNHLQKFHIAFITLLLISVFSPPPATAENDPESRLSADSSAVDVRLPDSNRIASYQNDPDFRYNTGREEQMSFMEMLLFELIRFLERMFGDGTGEQALNIFFLIVVIAALALLINQLMKGNIRGAFYGRQSAPAIRFSGSEETMSTEQLDRLIGEARKSGNYREAVRLTYYKLLRELAGAGLISWASGKTNIDYLYELQPHPSAGPMKQLTRIYDFTEYGNFDIDSSGYDRVEQLSKQIMNRISKAENGPKG
jgi:hypothetical protein